MKITICTKSKLKNIRFTLTLVSILFLLGYSEMNAQVSGKCFIDANKNGVFDQNELVMANTQLRIYKFEEKKNYNMIFGKPSDELLIEVKTDANGNYKIFPTFYPAQLIIYIDGKGYSLVPPATYTQGDIGLKNGDPYIILRNKGQVNIPLFKN